MADTWAKKVPKNPPQKNKKKLLIKRQKTASLCDQTTLKHQTSPEIQAKMAGSVAGGQELVSFALGVH